MLMKGHLSGKTLHLTQAIAPWADKVDILINNTGGAPAGLIADASVSDFEAAYVNGVALPVDGGKTRAS